MNEGKRIAEIRKFLELTQTQLSSIMETTQNNVSLIENGKCQPSAHQIDCLVDKIHANRNWIAYGDGDMFTVSDIPQSYLTAEQIDKIIANSHPQVTSVPYYDKPIGGISESRETTFIPKYMIDYAPFNDCTFYRPVYGESMSPKFKSGDVVACKRLSNKDYVMYGEAYLCIFRRNEETIETLRTLRICEDSSKISLVPLNPNYDSITIPKSTIEVLYIVKGKIERFI